MLTLKHLKKIIIEEDYAPILVNYCACKFTFVDDCEQFLSRSVICRVKHKLFFAVFFNNSKKNTEHNINDLYLKKGIHSPSKRFKL